MTMSKFIKNLIGTVALVLFVILNPVTCFGDSGSQDIHISLSSYDIMHKYNTSDDSTSVWLRFIINTNFQSLSIENIELSYTGPNADKIDYLEMLSVPDPDLYGYYYGYINLKGHIDCDVLCALIHDGIFSAELYLKNTETETFKTQFCNIVTNNAVMDSPADERAFELTIKSYEYQELTNPDVYFRSYPGLEEYLKQHPADKCYQIILYGTEQRAEPYKAILGLEFYSLSDDLFLQRYGSYWGEAISCYSDAYDLLYETQKGVRFDGVLCAKNPDTIQERLQNAEMYVVFSTEYSGTFDLSDAGDRFDGPRLSSPITFAGRSLSSQSSDSAGAGKSVLSPVRNIEDLCGYLNESGNWEITPQYDYASLFAGQYAVVSSKENGNDTENTSERCMAIINNRGETILDHLSHVWHYKNCYWFYGYECDDDNPFCCFDWRTGKTIELNPNDGYAFCLETSIEGNIVPIRAVSDNRLYGFYDLEHEKVLFTPQFVQVHYNADCILPSWNNYYIIAERKNSVSDEYVSFYLLSADGSITALPSTIQLSDDGILFSVKAKKYNISPNGITCITEDNRAVLMDYELKQIAMLSDRQPAHAEVTSYSIDLFRTITFQDLLDYDIDLLSHFSQEEVNSITEDTVYHNTMLSVRIENAWWSNRPCYFSITDHHRTINMFFMSDWFIDEKKEGLNVSGYIWQIWINTGCNVEDIIHNSQVTLSVYDEETDQCLEIIPIVFSNAVMEEVPADGFSIKLERAKVYNVPAFDMSKYECPLILRELDMDLSISTLRDIAKHRDEYYVCVCQGIKQKSMDKNVYSVQFGIPSTTEGVQISKSNRHAYGYLGDADSSDCDDMTENGSKYIEIRLLIHTDDPKSIKDIIRETPINAYFATMCYVDSYGDDEVLKIAGPVQHVISVDTTGMLIYRMP